MNTNTILMYVVNSEAEIPAQPQQNIAYYIIGKEVRIIDNNGVTGVFKLAPSAENKVDERLTKCEKQISTIIKHLTSFTTEV